MRAALAAGAAIINDVSGLTGERDSLAIAAAAGCPVVVMHMRGTPEMMQECPVYRHAALDVFDWLEARVAACRSAGIPLERIAVDPGIGFGKTLEHNIDIMRCAALYHGLGCAVLFGVSRKRYIAALSRNEPPLAREAGSLAAALELMNQGVQILRVHDVKAATQARAVWEALHS
ncbi:hypothetical protein CCP2SC5_2540002 [Azospirillaceae bacterium]